MLVGFYRQGRCAGIRGSVSVIKGEVSLLKLIAVVLLCAGVSFSVNAQSILYGIENVGSVDSLIKIDTSTGAITEIVQLGHAVDGQNTRSLAYDSTNDVFYAIDTQGQDSLVRIDRVTGVSVLVSELADDNTLAMAYDSSTDTLYGSIPGADNLVTINRTTGALTHIGNGYGFATHTLGLAYDSTNDKLYAVTANYGNMLFLIDRITGSGTKIGTGTGFTAVRGLAYDASTDMLYGVDDITDQLITIDRDTGIGTVVGPLTGGAATPSVSGLAFAPAVSPTQVAMDINPADPNNYVETEGVYSTKVQVAILGDTEFDATQVDATTLQFGPNGTAAFNPPGIVRDADGDGLTDDLQVKFRVIDTGIACEYPDDVELTGETFSGEAFSATDSVTTPDCPTAGCHP